MNKTLIIEMSNMWKALTEAEKEKYKLLAIEDKSWYEKEMKEYLAWKNLSNVVKAK